MAQTIQAVIQKLIRLLEIQKLGLSDKEKNELISTGFLTLNGLSYTVPNPQAPTRYGVNVNKNWFRGDFHNKSKPQIRRNGQVNEIDFNLLPVGNKIFIIHYLKLREYALQLENDKQIWFDQTRWGMVIDPINENFYWVENNKRFPLTTIRHIDDFSNFEKNINDSYKKFLIDPPISTHRQVNERRSEFLVKNFDFTEIEKNNKELGQEGEKFIVQQEHERLQSIGRPELAEKIEWTSEVKGDGAGYDILSFEETGEPRYIEVKTTTREIDAPFLITKNEVDFSQSHIQNYYLYRVFNFKDSPRFFILEGNLEEHCQLIPKLFEARI